MAGLFQRAFGGGNSLEADLRRVTESGVIEVPKDLLNAVSQASHNVEDRREIMKHLRECLAEPSAKRWRRVYAALLLVEDLLKHGSQDLLGETAEGHHFDLVQRLSLLEHFECSSDRRVQGMVRAKATALRGDIVPRLQTAHEHEASRECCASTCSQGAALSSCSTASTSLSNTSPTGGSGAPWRPPEGQMVLNGIVAVGHTDDTTSESSGDEAPKAVQFREMRKSRKASTQNRRPVRARSDDSTDDDAPCGRQDRGSAKAAVKQAPPPAPAPMVDLLDL
uniref:ENTH domain-containing protein n=1 Tax=Alexandrium catenella TaxID=2925 RepID=A0A7S1QWQ5_ALECA|mmetsp:Transcript_40404/g.109193  ORF Transcript_40404/g.109193 Transcript_40404/m.109193 type:complete len:280 (+) Transcript_40404:56-895(+)